MSGVGQPLALLSSSAFSALVSIRGYIADHDVTADVAVAALTATSADFSNSNVATARALHSLLPQTLGFNADYRADLRSSIAFLIDREQPWWRKLFPSGRSHVAGALSENEWQAFSDAGLFESPPSPAVMAWWYAIQSKVRAEQDTTLSEQGGGAELLTLDFEIKRLQALGISAKPELRGFEDNSLGYDVKSFDPGADSPVARLIEVKSSHSSPPRIFLPRREWTAALKYGAAFRFYLWWGPAPKLAVFTTKQMATHIPQDHGEGEWQEVEITFDPAELLSKYATA